MLSSDTVNCQATKIVMNSGSQLSALDLVSQMSQVSRILFVFVIAFVFLFVIDIVFLLARSYPPITLVVMSWSHKKNFPRRVKVWWWDDSNWSNKRHHIFVILYFCILKGCPASQKWPTVVVTLEYSEGLVIGGR